MIRNAAIILISAETSAVCVFITGVEVVEEEVVVVGLLRHLSQQFTSLSVSLCLHLEVLGECVSGIWSPTRPPPRAHGRAHALVFCRVQRRGATKTPLALSSFTANRYSRRASLRRQQTRVPKRR